VDAAKGIIQSSITMWLWQWPFVSRRFYLVLPVRQQILAMVICKTALIVAHKSHG